MSFENNDVLANLFANAIRSPQPSTSMGASPAAARPTLAHSKSIGAEPSTPRRPVASGKRVPRRSTASFSTSGTPVPLMSSNLRKGGSVSPPNHHHLSYSLSCSPSASLHLHGSASPFAGAKFSESPSARAIPLPPTVWFEDDESPCPPSDTESISSFTTSSSASSSDDCGLSSSSLGLESGAFSSSGVMGLQRERRGFVGGVRVTPLQLIAAVSAN